MWTLPWRDDGLAKRAAAAAGDVDASLALAADIGPVARALRPGAEPWAYLSTLATLGSVDLTTARVVEPHLDALAILDQAGALPTAEALGSGPSVTWGVYAAEGPGRRLHAAADGGGAWTLTGSKPWCSLADRLTHAVVTAYDEDSGRRAFAVDLRGPGVTAAPDPWVSRGLAAVRSTGLTFNRVPAVPLGGPDWYLARPGFAWGGIGVAAVWFGAAQALRDRLVTTAYQRAPDQIALLHLGTTDKELYAGELALRHAAAAIQAGEAVAAAGAILAQRVRAVIAVAAEHVLTAVGHGLGPAPLTGEEEHARRVADLTIYLRQHHAERDLVRLGEQSLDRGTSPESVG